MIELIAVFRIDPNISSQIACSEPWIISSVTGSDGVTAMRGMMAHHRLQNPGPCRSTLTTGIALRQFPAGPEGNP